MKTLLLVWALAALPAFQDALLFLTGASCIEELSEEEIQRYQSLAAHPLDLNRAPRSRLLSSGLLSPYQVASLLDYRSRSGELLSWSELALVDGFPADYVTALREFAVLGTGRLPPGQAEARDRTHTLTLRSSLRDDGTQAGSVRYEAAVGQRLGLYATWNRNRTAPASTTLSAVYYGKGRLGQLILGNFQARFGQGLLAWSAFRLSGYNSVSSFRRNGTGLSPTGSASASLCGIAADWDFGPWRLSTAFSWAGQGWIAHLGRTGRILTGGVTATPAGVSWEARGSLPGWSFFGELALDRSGSPTGIVGMIRSPEYGRKWALLGRWLGPVNSYSGMAAGYAGPALECTLDAGWRMDKRIAQYKALLQWKPVLEAGGLRWSPLLRLQERFRPSESVPWRSEWRAALTVESERWSLAGRADAVLCRGLATLGYVEAGWKRASLTLYLRAGVFRVDHWDDRIYVYERDAPGSFHVPAYYGRGWDASCYAAWHIARHHSLWLRAETVRYPWNPAPKEPRTELRLQYRLNL